MDDSWKNDPRLKTMDKEKLELLTRFAEQAGRSKKEELPQTLMAIHLEAQKQGIHFNDKETALLINILSAHMTPKEKKKVDLLKMISQKLMAGKKPQITQIFCQQRRTRHPSLPTITIFVSDVTFFISSSIRS